MNLEQINDWIAEGEFDEIESAWMAAAEAEGVFPPEDAAKVLEALVAADQADRAETLGWALLEERAERLAQAERLELAKAMAQAVPLSAELRQQACDLYRELSGPHPHFDALMRASELMNAPTPRRAFVTLDLCLWLEDGCFVANRFQNQVLQIRQFVDGVGEYELEDLSGGSVTLEARKLADEFERIDETDFRILSHRDPERLKELFQSEPASVLVGICQSREGSIDSLSLKEMLVPRYIEKDKWSSWWGRARTAAKRCPHLSLEGRNPFILTYHREGLSLEDELAGELESAKTPGERLELARRYAREAKQRKVAIDPTFSGLIVEALAADARSFVRSRPADALTAALGVAGAGRLHMPAPAEPYPSAAEVLAAADQPAAAVAALEDSALWPPALDALCQRDDAPDQLEALLLRTPAKLLDQVAAPLHEAGRSAAVAAAAARALAEPLEHLELCLWLWAGPAEPIGQTATKLEILSRLLKALHDLDIDAQLQGLDRKEIQLRIRAVLGAKQLAGFREVVAQIDEAMASILKTRITRTDGLAESLQHDMLAILRENFYGLFAKARIEPWADESVLWTTEAALRRYEADLKELLDVTIPANSRAIGAAAEHGDLSENSEWKFAIEERNKLQARQAKMQDDLAKAHILDPADVPSDSVGIGSLVRLRREGDGQQLELSLLGPWDTDLQRRRYSYQTALAANLLGKAVGEAATLRLDGVEAEYTIESLGVAEF